jgi:tetratricopeptide (TPR) repeat protein
LRSSAHSIDYVVDDLARQLLSSDLLPAMNSKDFAQSIIRISKDQTWSLAAAVLFDVAGKMLPGSQKVLDAIAKQISRELAESAPPSMIKALREKAPQDLLIGFISILAALNDRGVSGTIIVDQVEAASEAVREKLLGLAVEVPTSWNILFVVNDELPEGITFLRTTWPRLAYEGGIQVTVHPLRVDDLEMWCLDERGSAPSLLELQSVLSNCEGRPLLLREWVSGASTQAEVTNIWERLGPYYSHRLNSLSREARALVRALALLPTRSAFSLTLIRYITKVTSASAAFEIVEELIGAQFLEAINTEDTYKFVHEITRRQVLMSTPQGVSKEAAATVGSAVKMLAPGASDLQQRYTLAILEYKAEDYAEFLPNALTAAKGLLETESYTTALELYQDCFSIPSEMITTEFSSEAQIGAAEVMYATGYYGDGLEFLKQAEAWPASARARALLTRGKLLLRLTRFPESLTALKNARLEFSRLASSEGLIQCDKEEITILRDLGHYTLAVDKTRSLLAQAQESGVSETVLGSCYRAMARSLAFTGPLSDALEYAERAHDIATSSGSALHVGNARLAFGEAYRLANVPVQAVSHYQAAAQTALALGNRDSYLWSSLGLADCYLISGDVADAQNILRPIGDIVGLSPNRYPLVYLHWQLCSLSNKFILGEDVNEELHVTIRQYAELGIEWPREYAEILLTRGPVTPKRFG